MTAAPPSQILPVLFTNKSLPPLKPPVFCPSKPGELASFCARSRIMRRQMPLLASRPRTPHRPRLGAPLVLHSDAGSNRGPRLISAYAAQTAKFQATFTPRSPVDSVGAGCSSPRLRRFQLQCRLELFGLNPLVSRCKDNSTA